MFDRIVAYGCSLTSGFELADTILTGKTQDEVDKIKRKGVEKYVDYLDSFGNRKELENSQSWVRWLADIKGVTYLNRAVEGGNSSSSIYFLEQDIANGVIKDTDLVIVAHTEYSRWFWLNNKGKAMHGCVGGSETRWPSKNFHRDFITYVANDYNLVYQFYKDITYLENFKVKQIFCYNTFNKIKDRAGNILPMINNVNSYKTIVDQDFSFDNVVDWNNKSHLHLYTHPKVEYHKKFAECLSLKI